MSKQPDKDAQTITIDAAWPWNLRASARCPECHATLRIRMSTETRIRLPVTIGRVASDARPRPKSPYDWRWEQDYGD